MTETKATQPFGVAFLEGSPVREVFGSTGQVVAAPGGGTTTITSGSITQYRGNIVDSDVESPPQTD